MKLLGFNIKPRGFIRMTIAGIVNLFNFIVHFLLVQKTNPKKTPVPFGLSDSLALLENDGILKTRSAQTVQNSFSSFSALLSKWQWDSIVNLKEVKEKLLFFNHGRVSIIITTLVFCTPNLQGCGDKPQAPVIPENEKREELKVVADSSKQKQVYSDIIIKQDMTWSGEIDVKGVFVVGRGATLTIEAGTTVRFHKIDTNKDNIGDSEIRVLGGIKAIGTKEAPILFKSAEKYPAPMDWSYVLIFTSAQRNVLQYCIFRDAFTGLQVHFSTASVSDSIFTNNNEGLRFGRTKFNIKHNTIEKNNIGVRFTRMEGPVEITNNNITNNRIGVFLVPSSQNIVDFFEPSVAGKPWNEGHLLIKNNNIFGNSDYNLNLGAKQKWDLAIDNNWWGTSDIELIKETIFDKSRDDVLGKAIFEPVLLELVTDASPR